MKPFLFKLFTSILIICTVGGAFAQDFQGKAYYQSKTTMDMSRFTGNRQFTPDQIKRFQERMKSFLEKQYTLVFNKEESIYKEEERIEAPNSGRGWGGFSSGLSGGPKYKNVKTKELLQDQEFFGKQFLIKDELEPLAWKMGSETKQIGQYACFKATAIIPDTSFDWGSRSRRNDEEKDESKEGEEEKTIEVVAWYTPQVPINQGPDNYWGLPGLILEVSAGRTTILCTKIVMNPKEKEEIKKPEKGEEVTQEEYTKITTEKMEEMREMRGRRQGNGRRN